MASLKGYRLQTKRDNYREKARGFNVTKKEQTKYSRLAEKYYDKLTRYKARRRARQFSIAMSVLSTVVGVIIVYVLFNFLVDSTFQFNFISFVETLSNMPLLSLTNI